MKRIDHFPQYSTDYISGCMSLRTPQNKSLKILEDIINLVNPSKEMDLNQALEKVNKYFPILTDFERDFMSLTFALATGVGKTRLMGAFITYLYTNYGVKNFFVVAPGKIVYDKLKKDLGDSSSSKYVFKGIGCFSKPPEVIADDDYQHRQLNLMSSDIKIYIFNIDKFNSEGNNMRATNEYLGGSFFNILSELDDLVLIMDESHHYRAESGWDALNELNPVLGLELTATPLYNKGAHQLAFNNVVYEYPLSEAIKDGYTRTPYAVTRSDINFYNFDDKQKDKMMLEDGIISHEKVKNDLLVYSSNNQIKEVKPFIMVVCKDTEHATNVYNYICSGEFREGKYINKTLIIHSNQTKIKREASLQMLLDVESSENPIEIVIHVDMLKEGWDVNNLYTIVPLRTAASQILREQMVGRGLRLPYGERTGDKNIDAVMLTAHDNFDNLIREAQKGDSIFNAGNVIFADQIKGEEVTYTNIEIETPNKSIEKAYEQTGLDKNKDTSMFFENVEKYIKKVIPSNSSRTKNYQEEEAIKDSVEKVEEIIKQNKDLSEVLEKNEDLLSRWIKSRAKEVTSQIFKKFIPIPQIKVTDVGVEEYQFTVFKLDLSMLNYVPIESKLLIQNLQHIDDLERIKGGYIDFEGYNPESLILSTLREKPEIDYEKCSNLLHELVSSVINHFENIFDKDGMKNIVIMNKRRISDEIYRQMMNNFYYKNGSLEEEVDGISTNNLSQTYTSAKKINLFDNFDSAKDGNIKSILFEDIKKGIFSSVKFDSVPELIFARIIERDEHVRNWFRPAINEFNIFYNRGKRYQPDFVVETENKIYLVEVKGEDKINDADVIAKRDRGSQYCEVVSRWSETNGYKSWVYLFIPSKEVSLTSTFKNLSGRFTK